MKLRDFISNNSEVNSKFEEEDRMNMQSYESGTPKEVVKSSSKHSKSPLTKRQVLHIIASIYDPMGWLAPMLVPAKAFLQQLWAEKVSWDVELSQKQEEEWSSITEEWENTALTVPRRIGIAEDEDYTLHCFVDASKTAFAAAVYYLASGGNHPHLLMAIVLGSKLVTTVSNAFKKEPIRKVLWSDSSCCLHWILGEEENQKRFIANRVKQIKANQDLEFRHVPGEHNPADLSSRGCTPNTLISSKVWWRGPEWLLKEDLWPPNIEVTEKAKLKRTTKSIHCLLSQLYQKLFLSLRK
uniref:Uncharacterized protein n=1 Tax=Ditylenchus dipsaci TaxID=166011 RepID=A0A915E1H7_9BILA